MSGLRWSLHVGRNMLLHMNMAIYIRICLPCLLATSPHHQHVNALCLGMQLQGWHGLWLLPLSCCHPCVDLEDELGQLTFERNTLQSQLAAAEAQAAAGRGQGESSEAPATGDMGGINPLDTSMCHICCMFRGGCT